MTILYRALACFNACDICTVSIVTDKTARKGGFVYMS